MSKLIFKGKFFITLALVFAMFAGAALPAYAGSVEYTVSMQPVDCHGMYSDLNTKEQKNAYKAIVKKLKSGEYKVNKNGRVFLYRGRLNTTDFMELAYILLEEFYPATGGFVLWYDYNGCSKGELSLYAEPSAFKAFQENAKYIKKLQKKARELCDDGMTEKQASDTISKWIRNRTSYKDGSLDNEVAWWTYKNKAGNCAGYSKLYKIMCNGVGIDCNLVIGHLKGGCHEFNRVKINDTWYYADLTFYDTGRKEKKYAYSKSLWSGRKLAPDHFRTCI